MKHVQFVGGPMCGKKYPWTTARYVQIPDASDMRLVFMPEWGGTVTLFGRHTYEMRCYRMGGRHKCQLEHVKYERP